MVDRLALAGEDVAGLAGEPDALVDEVARAAPGKAVEQGRDHMLLVGGEADIIVLPQSAADEDQGEGGDRAGPRRGRHVAAQRRPAEPGQSRAADQEPRQLRARRGDRGEQQQESQMKQQPVGPRHRARPPGPHHAPIMRARKGGGEGVKRERVRCVILTKVRTHEHGAAMFARSVFMGPGSSPG